MLNVSANIVVIGQWAQTWYNQADVWLVSWQYYHHRQLSILASNIYKQFVA